MNVLNYTHVPSLHEIEDEYFRESGIPAVVFLSILMVVGVTGNSHILIVYGTSKKMAKRQTVKIFILWVSAIDLIVCVACMSFSMLNIRFNYTFVSSETCKIFRFLTFALSLSSFGFLTAIALQRFRYTDIYLARTTVHQNRNFNIISATIVVICTVLSEPVLHYYGIEKRSTNLSELTGAHCALLLDNRSVAILKSHGIMLIFICTFCFIISVVCYGKIICVICAQMKAKTNTNVNTLYRTTAVSSTKEDQHFDISVEIKSNTDEEQTQKLHKRNGYEKGRQLTIGLITATAISYFGYLIYGVACLIMITNHSFTKNVLDPEIILVLRVFFIHHVANPVMLFLLDREFREECLKLYKKATCWTKLKEKARNFPSCCF